MERSTMVKWKYREIQPGKKHHTIDRYISYIEKQVNARRENSGAYSVMDTNNLIGNPDHDKEKILEKKNSHSSDEFEQGKYLSYINERKGSSGTFSSPAADVAALKDSLKNHEGAVWIPIVSLKESDAVLYGLDTEAAWILKGRELAEEYRKIMNIEPENFRWLAAFHTKSDADQNHAADAGSQPHLHFMIWEETPMRRKYKLSYADMEKIHERTASVLSREYMKNNYQKRNELREQIKRNSLDDIENFANDIKSLVLDIKVLTDGKGKMNFSELEKRQAISSEILDKLETKKALSQTEEFYKDKLNINSLADAKRVIYNHAYVVSELENLTDRLLNQDDTKDLIEEWKNLSMTMRSAQGTEKAEELTAKDLQNIRREVLNGILKECKSAQYDNPFISDSFKGMLIEKIDQGIFKEDVDFDTMMNTSNVIASLCKAINISEEDAKKAQEELLERSQKLEYQEYIEKEIERVYKATQLGFPVTTQDFWLAMKAIKVPTSRMQAQYRNINANPYELQAKLILEPVRNSGTLLQNSISYKNTLLTKSIFDVDRSSIALVPKTREEYAAHYQYLLDAFSGANQSILERDLFQIELTKEV